GEPLVDLRDMETPITPSSQSAADDALAEALLSGADPAPAPPAPNPFETVAPAAEPEASAPSAPHVPDPFGAATAPVSQPDPLAAVAGAAAAPAAATGAAPAPGTPALAADGMAIRDLILQSLAAGQTRESIAAYLRDQLGFVEPGLPVDAALVDRQ